MTVKVIKDILRTRKLKLSGKKADLIIRLQTDDNANQGVETATPPVGVTGGDFIEPVGIVTAGDSSVTVINPTPVVISRKSTLKGLLTEQIRSANLPLEELINIIGDVYGLKASHKERFRSSAQDNIILDNLPIKTAATYESLKKLKVAELKKILKARKEKLSGKKDDLINRILNPTPAPIVATGTSEETLPLPVESSGSVSNIDPNINIATDTLPALGPLNTLDALPALGPLNTETNIETVQGSDLLPPIDNNFGITSPLGASVESIKSPLVNVDLSSLESIKSPLSNSQNSVLETETVETTSIVVSPLTGETVDLSSLESIKSPLSNQNSVLETVETVVETNSEPGLPLVNLEGGVVPNLPFDSPLANINIPGLPEAGGKGTVVIESPKL